MQNQTCDYQLAGTPSSVSFQKSPIYQSVSGKVIQIEPYLLTLQTSETNQLQFQLSTDTYFVDCFPITIGAELIGFYQTSKPMPLIYPPRYPIDVVAFQLSGRFVKTDFFDCFLVSSDGALQLSISNNSYVVNRNGTPTCSNLSNQVLTVLYRNTTKSIPAITNPDVVIHLN